MDEALQRYLRTSEWTAGKVSGAVDRLEAPTPDDEWSVGMLLNHMLETQRYFARSARGEHATLPSPQPPAQLAGDPVVDFERVRQEVVDAFSQPGVLERARGSLGIACSDLLIHGWDVARATHQDDTMPGDLADAAYAAIFGRFGDEQRRGLFKPAIEVDDDAPIQARLLAYTGRDPSG